MVCRILFYPTLLYSGWVWSRSRFPVKDGGRNGEAEADPEENTPLLRERS
jgi:hypothetical protein